MIAVCRVDLCSSRTFLRAKGSLVIVMRRDTGSSLDHPSVRPLSCCLAGSRQCRAATRSTAGFLRLLAHPAASCAGTPWLADTVIGTDATQYSHTVTPHCCHTCNRIAPRLRSPRPLTRLTWTRLRMPRLKPAAVLPVLASHALRCPPLRRRPPCCSLVLSGRRCSLLAAGATARTAAAAGSQTSGLRTSPLSSSSPAPAWLTSKHE